MSFILDALKKSENDRQRQASPALFEVKVASPRRRFPPWAFGLGVLLGVNLLVLAWVLLREPAVGIATSAASETPSRMVTLTMPADATSTVTLSPNRPEASVVAPSTASPLTEEPLLSGSEPSVPPDYEAYDHAPAVSAAQSASTVPSRDEILAQGTQLPDLRLDLHVFSPQPADRFVFINMRKLREGESLPEGVRVEAITPMGAELSFRGQRFAISGN